MVTTAFPVGSNVIEPKISRNGGGQSEKEIEARKS
jgi:hypothetical protein